MKIGIAGSGAGGGLPQWNCNCANWTHASNRTGYVLPRIQASIAVGGNGVDWIPINASPGLLAQLRANPKQQTSRAIRATSIAVDLIDVTLNDVKTADAQ